MYLCRTLERRIYDIMSADALIKQLLQIEHNDDILAIPSPELQGFGYFQNVGSTRRQGIEAEVNVKSSAVQAYASYALVDARFLDSLLVGSNSPFRDSDGNVQISPGNQVPAVPRHRFKAGIKYAITDAFKVGADAVFVSSQYFVGDESNQAARLPSYTVVNAHASYQINKTFQIYGRIDNIFDNRYATYGTFFGTTAVPNFAMAAWRLPTRVRLVRRAPARSMRACEQRSSRLRAVQPYCHRLKPGSTRR
jgi:outer membrane receptor protein involved in Fe transport